MPFTPLRHEALKLEPSDWTSIAQRVKVAAGSRGFEFRIAADWDDYFFSQVVAMGGYWLHSALVDMVNKGHFYDGCIHPGIAADLRAWMEQQGYWNEEFLAPKVADYPFPLAFLEGGVSQGFLFRQFQKSTQAEDTGYCLSSRCQACDACETPDQRRFLKDHELKSEGHSFIQRFRQRTQEKRLLKPIAIRIYLPDVCCWKSAEWSRAWVMRELLQFFPDQIDNLLSVREVLFHTGDLQHQLAGVAGWTVFAVKCWEPAKLVDAMVAQPHPEKWTVEGVELSHDVTFREAMLRLTIDPSRFPNPERSLAGFLQQNYCPCQMQRTETGCLLIPGAKALKKKQLIRGLMEQVNGIWRFELQIGPKFDLLAWLKKSAPQNWRSHMTADISSLQL